jgi:hypothetical protein
MFSRDPTVANPAQARLKPLKLKGAVSDRNQAVKPIGENLSLVTSLAECVGSDIRMEEVRMSCRTSSNQ